MDLDALVNRFPRLWHATFTDGWEGIQRSGLRSSLGLLEDAGRAAEAEAPRAEPLDVKVGDATAVLRKQVVPGKDLAPFLAGIDEPTWWRLVNGRSYFFVDRDAADTFVDGYLEAGIAQELVTFETRRLLADVADHVEITTVNTSIFPKAKGPARGPATFQPLAGFEGMPAKIKEVTLTTDVTVADNAVVSVVRLEPKSTPVRIFPAARVRA